MRQQTESVADFKARIAQMMRERETGKKFAIVGASRAHECVVRNNSKEKDTKKWTHATSQEHRRAR
jgi:hypothetical protein